MRRQLTLATGLFIALAQTTGVALAHDADKHKGSATHGTVAEVSATELTVKTDSGAVSFVVSPDTEVERGEHTAKLSDIAAGEKVAVFGTKLPGGKTAASQVVIGEDSHHGHE
jgi:predicted deacylase